MEGRLPDGSLLRRVFEAIYQTAADVNLECNEAGITMQAMDASHVALVALDLKSGAFDHWNCIRPRTLGLNMVAVNKVFKICGPDDQVIIRQADDTDSVVFVFDSAGDNRMSDFELKLMQIDQDHLGVPETEFDAVIVLPSKNFQKVVNDLASFSDTIMIEVSSKGIKFTAKGDIGTGNTTYQAGSDGSGGELKIETRSTTQLWFSARYLSQFVKGAPLSDSVQLQMSPGQPLEVTYVLRNDPGVGTLKYYLAPKMDEVSME